MNKSSCIQSSFKKSMAYSQCLALESRMVFDGAVVATAVDAQQTVSNQPSADPASVTVAQPSEPVAHLLPENTPQTVDYLSSSGAINNHPQFFIAPDLSNSIDPHVVTGTNKGQATAIFIVDPRVENVTSLSLNPPANTQVIVLDATRDGFQQIAELLQSYHNNVTELHVLPWTQNNQQWLGSQALTATLDSSVTHSLMTWNDGLADNAKLEFNGQANLGADWAVYVSALTGTHISWSENTSFVQDNTPAISKPPTSIFFIDSTVQNASDIVSAIDASAEIVYLNANQDGLTQIANYLNGRTGIDSIQIISHGNQATLHLGNETLTNDNLASHAAQLSAIGYSLTVSGDILLYGCDLAKGTDGKQFVDSFSYLTHADIAASTDDTGAASKGGNWTLEYSTGSIEASVLAASHYQDILALPMQKINVNGLSLAFNNPTVVAGTGLGTGDVVKFANVVTVNGQQIDAIVTIAAIVNNTSPAPPALAPSISALDSAAGTLAAPLNPNWFELDLNAPAAGGASTTIKFEFIDHITGADVLLQNVVVNSYDIDSNQFQDFSGFSSYSIANNTTLAVSGNGNFTHFADTSGANNTATPATNLAVFNQARVTAFYNEINTFQIETGTNQIDLAFFYLDFSGGPGWIPPAVTHSVPNAVDDTQMGTVGQPVPIKVLANDIATDNTIVPSTLQIIGTTNAGDPLIVPGQGTWSVVPDPADPTNRIIIFTPLPTFTGDPTPIQYTVQDTAGLPSDIATVTVDYPPTVTNDTVTGIIVGGVRQPVLINVTANDSTDVDPKTVQIVGTANVGDSLVVPGQGTWSVNAITGAITFTPIAGFIGDPTPIQYTAKDVTGNVSPNPATVTVDYPPTVTNDTVTGIIVGGVRQPVLIDVKTNDSTDVDPKTVQIVGTANVGDSLVVLGQGTWSVNATTGAITFTPIAGFIGDPTPIQYTAKDVTGNVSPNPATVTVDYPPIARPDTVTGVGGNPVIVNILGNDGDTGIILNPASVQIVGTATAGTPLVVPNEGTWTVDSTTGAITFTPIAGFVGSPTPINYTVKDTGGLVSGQATVTVNNPPIARPDTAIGIAGNPVVVNILGNDGGSGVNLNPASVQIVGTATAGAPLVVPNQGTWSVNPATGAITFIPITGFTGSPDPISYTVKDTAGLISAATTVTVSMNKLPIAISDTNTATEGGTAVIGNIIANELTLGDIPTLVTSASQGVNPIIIGSVFTTAAGGILILNADGSYSYTPPRNVPIGGVMEQFNYTITDSNGDISNSVLTIIVNNIPNTSGSLIQLSNPALPSTPIEPLFVAKPLPLQPTVLDLSLYIPSPDGVISLTGSLRDQVVLELRPYSFDIPKWSFSHTKPNEQLVFDATYPDGSSLPDWLMFNPKLLRFSGIPPKGAHDEQVMVTATDSYGNEVHAIFTVHVNKERARPEHKSLALDLKLMGLSSKVLEKEQHKEKVVGKPALSERINKVGKLGKLQESLMLLDSLKVR